MEMQEVNQDRHGKETCMICGNIHLGSCTTETIFFYWYPLTPTAKPPANVEIIGSWQKWQTHQRMILEKDTKGQTYFQLPLNLPVGNHQYKYIVDGVWQHNPHAPSVQDPYGGWNNIIEVFPKKAFMEYTTKQDIKISSFINVEGLKIVGSWDNWESERPMRKQYNSLKGCQQNVIYLRLVPNNTYQFKFKLGKQYLIDQKYPTVPNQHGSLNNIIITFFQRIDTPSSKWNISKINTHKEITCKCFQWKRIAVKGDFPYECVEGHTMCNIGEYIYIFGGRIKKTDFSNGLTRMSVHDYNNISAEQQKPDVRGFHCMATYGNKMIIYGGLDNNNNLQDYHAFNVTELKWHQSPNITGTKPHKRQKQSCVIYEMLLVFFGGYYCSPDMEIEANFNDIQVLNIENMTWIENIYIKGIIPPGRFDHTASLIDSNMYIFGGVNYSITTGVFDNFNDCWKINLANVNQLHWQELEIKGKKPPPRHGHSMNVLNDFLIIFGGQGDSSQLLNDLIVLDTVNNEWIYPFIQGEVPRPRYHHASTTVQGEYIMVFGGKTQDQRKIQHFYVLKPKQYKPSLNIEEQQEINEK